MAVRPASNKYPKFNYKLFKQSNFSFPRCLYDLLASKFLASLLSQTTKVVERRSYCHSRCEAGLRKEVHARNSAGPLDEQPNADMMMAWAETPASAALDCA
jgi:hypothetical protein